MPAIYRLPYLAPKQADAVLDAARSILPTAYLATYNPPTGLVLEVPDRVVVDADTERTVIRAVRSVLGD